MMACIVEDFGETERIQQQTINRLETLLCAACRVLEKQVLLEYVEPVCRLPLANWWNQHKAEENRKKALKLNALRKLTPEEKEILGLK